MKKLATPEALDTLAYYDRIVESKYSTGGHKAKLKQIRAEIAAAYANYYENRAQLDMMQPVTTLDDAAREALDGCWNSKTDALERMQRDIRSWQSGDEGEESIYAVICPYCGVGNASETFEHYLPRAERFFPEFIVYPYNLIPSCWKCNPNRGDWKDDKEQRLLIHFYFDEVPETVSYLKATLERSESGSWRARYDVQCERATPEFEAYERHFQTLDLGRRFRVYSIGKLKSIGYFIRSICQNGLREEHRVRGVLRDYASREAQYRGVNNVEPVTLDAAADSLEFIRHSMQSEGQP